MAQDDAVLTIDAPSRLEIVEQIGGLGSGAIGRPDLVLQQTHAIDDDSRILVETILVDEDSLPGAVVAFRVKALSTRDDDAWAKLTFDEEVIRNAFGADYSDRIRLVEFPACALTTPGLPACVRGRDLTGSTLEPDGNLSGYVELAVPDLVSGGAGVPMAVEGEGTIIAAVSGASGATGTFTATDLGTDSQWQVSEQYGSFAYSVPLRLPSVPVGPVPDVTVSYNSGVVDGQGLATNNQPSWVGQGWSLGTGYVERLYKSCYSDGYTSRAAELCWDSPYTESASQAAYVMSFGGTTQELIWDGDNRYRTASDNGWRITRHSRGAGTNGDDNGEYFKLMTPDGGVYWFGYGDVNQTGETSVPTDSVATVPVYGDDSGEPKCGGTAQSNYCMQGYRWMLDIEQDSNENATTYYYAQEENRYALGGDPAKPVTYTSAIVPFAINYGATSSTRVTGAEARVYFGTKARCIETADGTYDALSGQSVACPSAAKSNASSYPDTPLDLRCTATCTSSQDSPVFFSVNRLNYVNGYVKNTAGGWSLKVKHQFEFSYPGTKDGGARALWLNTIQSRYYGASGNDHVTDYALDFDGVSLKNRVDYTSSVRYMDKYRISEINTSDGLDVKVSYETAQASENRHCPTGGGNSSGFQDWYPDVNNGKWDTNTWDCFPQLFTNSSGSTGFAIFHKYLVDKVVLEDRFAMSPSQTFDYTYVGKPAWGYQNNILVPRGTAPQTWNSWRGYSQVKVTTGSGANESTVLTQYYRGMHDDWNVGGTTKDVSITPINNDPLDVDTTAPDYYSRRGLVIATRTYDSAGIIRKRTQNYYTGATSIDGPSLHNSVWLAVSDAYDMTRIVDADDGFLRYQVAKTSTGYDAYHRVSTVLVEPDTVKALDRCTTYAYVSGVGSEADGMVSLASVEGWGKTWYMWKVSYVKTFDGSCAGIQTGRTSFYYDGATNISSQVPTDGNVTREVSYSAADVTTAVTAIYDGRGRIVSAVLPDGTSKSTWAYSTDSAGFDVVTFKNAAGQAETLWSEPVFGNTVKVQHVNGLFEHFSYDAGGRVVNAYAAAQYGTSAAVTATDQPTTIYEYGGSAGTLARRATAPRTRVQTLKDFDGNGDSLRKYSVADGFGREVQSWTVGQGATGGRSVVTTTYDSVGNVTHVTAPFFNADSASWAANPVPFDAMLTPSYMYTTYDWAGRPTSVSECGSGDVYATTTHEYRGDRTFTVSPASITETIVDGAGRTTSTLTGTTSGAYTKATYTYAVDVEGKPVVTVKDAASKATVFTSDWLGRTVEMVDPNSGTTDYTYDVNGNVEQVDSAAGTIKTTFDSLGRSLTRTTFASPTATAVLSTTAWTYDTNGSVTAPGQLLKTVTSTEALTHTREVTAVDTLQRPTDSRVTLPNLASLGVFANKSFDTKVTYDTSGRVTGMTLPAVGEFAADKVTTGYTAFGEVRTLGSTDAGSILSSVTRTFDGRVTGRSLANGVNRTIVWDERYRRITGVSATTGTGSIQADTYGYDAAGRVKSIADGIEGLTQCYTYDAANRLVAAWTYATSTCAASVPTGASWNVAGEHSSYRNTWTYAPSGQISSASVATAAVPTVATTNYAYTNTSHPNAVSSTSGATVGAYVYDTAGRTTNRTNGAATQTLNWDTLSNLTSVTDGGATTTYLYDATGQRFAAIVGSTATIYMNGWEATDTNTVDNPTTGATDLSLTRFYTADGVQLASKTSAGTLTVTLGDVQGSAQVAVSKTGDTAPVITRNAYTPYGTERAGSDITSTHGWLNQIADTTGLTYLNARYYDPILARFLSPDPLMNPADPTTLDPYRYADNNPVMFTDANGLEPRVWDDGTITGVPTSSVAPRTSSGSSSSADSICSTGFACGSAKDAFYRSAGGAALGGLENWTRGFADSVIGLADLVITSACSGVHGGMLTSAGRGCFETNTSGGWTLPRIGASGFANAQASYTIGLFNNPTLLIGAEVGASALAGGTASRTLSSAANITRQATNTETTALFRSVGVGEAADIVATGTFNNVAGINVKYFATSADDAAAWGSWLNASESTVVTTRVPTAVLDGAQSWARLDGIGPAFALDAGQLANLNRAMSGITVVP